MGLWNDVQGSLPAKLLIGYVVVVSGFIVNFLQLCSCVIWPFNKTLYRTINYALIESHWRVFTGLAHWWSGFEVTYVSPEKSLDFIGADHSLVIMNHRFDLDWLLPIVVSEQFGRLGGARIFGKNMLKYVPIFGWAMYFGECIFLKRDWNIDKKIITRSITDMITFPYKIILLLFCEGTRFTNAKLEASNAVAREKGRPELKHHLLPRTRGFVLAMHGLKGKFPYIMDMTVAYRSDGADPTVMNIVKGKTCKAEIYVRYIKTEDVPLATDEECAEWCHQLYREKDEIYDSFVKNGKFSGNRFAGKRPASDLLMLVTWSALLLVPLVYGLTLLLFQGSLTMQIGFLIAVAVFSLAAMKIVDVSDSTKGSSYGKSNKSNNNKKVD